MPGNDPKTPAYIATVPRRGYRLLATVVRPVEEPAASPAPRGIPEAPPRGRPRGCTGGQVSAALLGTLVLATGLVAPGICSLGHPHLTGADGPSVGVLPFLDLTSQSMDEECLADGITEELIDELSKAPGLRVPAPTAVFPFKGRHLALTVIASALQVPCLLDGSVRRSGPGCGLRPG